MKLSSFYVREEEPWKKTALFKKFCLGEEEGGQLLSLLLQYGVLVPVKQGNREAEFKFSFVGIIFFKDIIIRCFPKYIRNMDTPHRAFAQVLNVLRCYGREGNAEYHPGGESGHMEFSLISAALALMEDYAEHGLYSNTVHDYEFNGSGEILWDRTLSSVEPFFSDEGPLFLDFHTKRSVDDTSDYVTRLHKHILTVCSRLLEDADLISVFSLDPLLLSDEPREHFGSDEYILQRLRAELDLQFDCHKQELLRQLIRFIEQRETWTSAPLHLYGTTDFEFVWEKVCATVFGNQLKSPLGGLRLPSGLKDDALRGTTLMQLIKKPSWHFAGGGSEKSSDTLKPDIVALHDACGAPVFLILDAKYYCCSPSSENLPGIGDISKQYLYELAFHEFLDQHGICRVKNIFLLPSEGHKMECAGHVEFDLFNDICRENIKIVLVPAEKAYAVYLREQNTSDFVHTLLQEVNQYPGDADA